MRRPASQRQAERRTTGLSFPASIDISERVLFPSGPTESHGMEDARFVRFVDDDGTVTYYATYTAFDGHQILPQLLETADFTQFRDRRRSVDAPPTTRAWRSSRAGSTASIVALGRHDNVNNFVMTSTDVRVWHDATMIQEPERPVGTDAARQLRITARDRGRLAGDHPRGRRRSGATHLARCCSTSTTRAE